ncbi:hypothetical protein FB382_003141 [Nocardioides ginsengisegetis]|uniref:Uncharacterized protein n=1 Tax=Nocardioides ginsengisegetis TaxID=661491 RepID=A0A7W3J206_9ACTN|nr:hypothetical protein [Nocardioides ginsengisegetis]MBA8804850.1 hypothetical protein [Nocardioides ginsengisegetis]
MNPDVCVMHVPDATADRRFEDGFGVVGDLLSVLRAAIEQIIARKGRSS